MILVSLAYLVYPVILASKESVETIVFLVRLLQREKMAILVKTEQKVILDRRVLWEILENKVLKDKKDYLVFRVLKVKQEEMVFLESMEEKKKKENLVT